MNELQESTIKAGMLTILSRNTAVRKNREINVGTRDYMAEGGFPLSCTDIFISMPFTVMEFVLPYI